MLMTAVFALPFPPLRFTLSHFCLCLCCGWRKQMVMQHCAALCYANSNMAALSHPLFKSLSSLCLLFNPFAISKMEGNVSTLRPSPTLPLHGKLNSLLSKSFSYYLFKFGVNLLVLLAPFFFPLACKASVEDVSSRH